MRVEAAPTSEEAAAIVAALAALRREETEVSLPKRDRWRLAGLLKHAPPRKMKLPSSLWPDGRGFRTCL